MVWNYVRLVDPENRIIRFFYNSENQGSSQNGRLKKKKKNQGNSQNLPQKLEPMVLTKKWELPNTEKSIQFLVIS
jgi:hypothetical protein